MGAAQTAQNDFATVGFQNYGNHSFFEYLYDMLEEEWKACF